MSIFPYINPESQETVNSTTPPLREYAYDFENQKLLLKEGKTYLVEGNEALRIWIYFALATARYRYVAYDAAFGSEIEDQLIGQSMDDDVVQSELERYITEALMANPYIAELSDFTFKLLRDGVQVSFTCTSVYGPTLIHYDIKGVI